MKVVWVGNKFSDIKYCNDYFLCSINLYGPNTQSTFSYANKRLSNSLKIAEADQYINYIAHQILLEHPDVEFMFYNPAKVYFLDSEIEKHTVCLNNKLLLKMLNNKSICHDLFSDIVNFAPYVNLLGQDIYLDNLKNIFNNDTFIVQNPDSAGGLGTFLVSIDEYDQSFRFKPNERFLISSYIHNNISFNVHILISADGYIIFPPSKQILSITNEGKFVYRGSDFINTNDINLVDLNKVLHKIVKRLKNYNYLGIIGLDFIQDSNGKIYFVEFNCRFQASSFLLNMALRDYNLPSLQELNYQAFSSLKNLQINEDFKVNYASTIFYEGADSEITVPNSKLLSIEDDSLQDYETLEKCSYLYKKVFTKSSSN